MKIKITVALVAVVVMCATLLTSCGYAGYSEVLADGISIESYKKDVSKLTGRDGDITETDETVDEYAVCDSFVFAKLVPVKQRGKTTARYIAVTVDTCEYVYYNTYAELLEACDEAKDAEWLQSSDLVEEEDDDFWFWLLDFGLLFFAMR